MSATSPRGPLVTLAVAALVGAGLLTADVLTDPVRQVAETPVVAATTTVTPAAATTTTTAPAATTTT
ncbi:MAG: hypothetical protein ABJA74_13400, partial [Lapillicoccus sp.]